MSGQIQEKGQYIYKLDHNGNGQFYRMYHWQNVADNPLPTEKWTDQMKMFDQGFLGTRSTETGKALFDYFSGEDHTAFYTKAAKNGCQIDGSHWILYTGEADPIPTTKGTDVINSPAWVSLAHEMAHRKDYYMRGNAACNRVWYCKIGLNKDGERTTEDILDTEKYATHIENIIRSEAKLPLRTHYDIEIEKSSIIESYTFQYNGAKSTIYSTKSMYFLNHKFKSSGSPDGKIGINVDPFDYSKDKDYIRK